MTCGRGGKGKCAMTSESAPPNSASGVELDWSATGWRGKVSSESETVGSELSRSVN